MKLFLVLNPGSRSGSSKRRFSKIFKLLNNNQIEYDFKTTKTLEEAYIFSKEANSLDYDAIIAVGGDGTINQVINGFYNEDGTRNSKALFGVIYTGTSPDFCKSYNIPLKLEEAVKTILKGEKRSIKIGQITLSTQKEEIKSEIRYFACCANIGLGATLARRANSGIRKYLGDILGTFTALIATLTSYKPTTYNCKTDTSQKKVESCYNLSIGITPFIASGIKVPAKNIPKNHFYIMGACDINFSNMTSVIKRVYNGKPFKNDKNLWIESATEITIEKSITNSEIEFDGDPIGYLPFTVKFASDELYILANIN